MIPKYLISLLLTVLVIGTADYCYGAHLQQGNGQLDAPGVKEIITGDNLLLAYIFNGVDYFFKSNEAIEAYPEHSLFQVVEEPGDGEDFRVSIRISGGRYLYINALNMLTVGTSDTQKSTFVISPVDETGTKFNLFLYRTAQTVGIVSPSTSSPFTFYLNTRYPDEPLAEFSLNELTVQESYSNTRDNINKTISLIRDSQHVDKTTAYAELLDLMDQNGHWNGTEIFTLGFYIKTDLGVESPTFSALPATVQLLMQGVGCKLVYQPNVMPMKYSWASDLHQNIRPYTFTRHEDTGLWAITYSSNSQLSALPDSPLVDALSDTKVFEFQLYLSISPENGESIQLFTYFPNSAPYNSWHPILELQQGLDYYFESRTGRSEDYIPGSNFVVSSFD